jgi:ATP/maltotriose-dependent transcriptional regulator MalT
MIDLAIHFSNHIVMRGRVVDAINAVADCKLITLTAPWGYGKSTAALQFAAKQSGRRVCFASVPPAVSKEGDDPAVLWKLLCAQFTSSEPTLLIIDDYYNVNNSNFDRFLEAFINTQSPDFTTLILSRIAPNINIDGRSAHLDKSVLTFTEEETKALFQLHQCDDDEVATSAWLACEGWIAHIWISLQNAISLQNYRDYGHILSTQGRAPLTPKQQAFMRMATKFELTAREQDVLELIINDIDIAAIGETLNISESAVRYHQTGLFRKLGQPNRRRLVKYFKEWS